VENLFSKMTRQRIRRGVLRSIADLQAAINVYLAEHNASPKPFVWTKCAEAILAKLDPLPCTICLSQCTSEDRLNGEAGHEARSATPRSIAVGAAPDDTSQVWFRPI
jgi:hypothetical protein